MKTTAAKVPVILAGGGSALLSDSFSGVSEVVRPARSIALGFVFNR
ncbi:hypothetical protein [Photobacterium rosenbergii]|uniref:Uncharacterized protein n=1 Tax=Photobacterium rosenbergii TaxID=294936 RepID=A0ABU3ZIY3_9GAMM|nr:hypothetical protein [Photobacterium rosenbergii]MDV5169943.1 hypothetical protein [Photobacterium rosenbergii]